MIRFCGFYLLAISARGRRERRGEEGTVSKIDLVEEEKKRREKQRKAEKKE